MAFLLLYYALLAVWPLLLWPALHLAGWSRAWLCLAAIAGLLASAHEIRMTYGAPRAIRLDIPLIAIMLCAFYAIAALALFRGRWRKSAAALGAVLLLAGGGMSYGWIEAGRESARLSEVFRTRNALLFEAKFRSRAAYESYFGLGEAGPGSLPVGHWEAQEGGYFSRLVVNPQGDVWAFYPCGETECDYRSADPGLQAEGDPAERRWRATLKPSVGQPATVEITQPDADHLTVVGRGQPTTLAKAPPPVDPAPPQEVLTFLGSFAQMDCRGQHADVRQLWLWREDARLYAVGIFATLLSGRRTDFVLPVVLGEGVRQGDGWSFDWRRDGQVWNAAVSLAGPDATLTLARDDEIIGRGALAPGAVFRDETIELAPLTGKVDWDHWFDVVLVGHFSSGDVPAC